MSLLSRLFGGGSSKSAAPATTAEEYKGFAITPQPISEGGKWRISALIEKDGKTHELIRADLLDSRDEAEKASLAKAQVMIDQMGDGLFA